MQALNTRGVTTLFYIMHLNTANFCSVWYYAYSEEIKALTDNSPCIVSWYIVLFVYLSKKKKGRISKRLYYENVSDACRLMVRGRKPLWLARIIWYFCSCIVLLIRHLIRSHCHEFNNTKMLICLVSQFLEDVILIWF